MDVLKALNSEGGAKLANAPPLKEDDPNVEGIEVKFVEAPWDQRKEMISSISFSASG
jgi:hypothetical protein